MIEQIIFTILFIVAFGLAARQVGRLRRNILLGRPEKIQGNTPQRLRNMFLVAFGQQKMFKRWLPAVLHLSIYVAFIITQIELIEIFLDGFLGEHRLLWQAMENTPLAGGYTFVISSIEVLSVLALIATFIFLARRNLLKIPRFQMSEMNGWPKLDGNLILYFEIYLVTCIFMMNAGDQALQAIGEYHPTQPFAVSAWIAPLLSGLSADTLHLIERVGWWGHLIGVLIFLNYLPHSKHLHIFLAFPNTYFARITPKGEINNMDAVRKEVAPMFVVEVAEPIPTNPVKVVAAQDDFQNPAENIDDIFGGNDDTDQSVDDIFGSSDDADQSVDDIFGSADDADQSVDDIFGSADDADQSVDDIFGSADDTDQSVDDIFGSSDDTDQSVDDIFGSADDTDQNVDDIFGSSDDTDQSVDDIFGSSDDTDQSVDDIFGSSDDADQSTDDIFGNDNTNETLVEAPIIQNKSANGKEATRPTTEPEEEVIKFGASDVFDLSWKNIMDAYSCTECGRCTSMCPANITGKKLSPRKVMMDVRDRAEEIGKNLDAKTHTLDHYDDGKNLFDYITTEELRACTTCNACVEACPVLINPLDIIVELRRNLILEKAESPEPWNVMFTNIENNGAPWQFSASDRDKWLEELE